MNRKNVYRLLLSVTGAILSIGLLFLWSDHAEAACPGVADCNNRTLTINRSTGGAGQSNNHVNFNIPVLACGTSRVGAPGGTGGCGSQNSAFNDTSSIGGTATGLCLNPASLSDPHCLRVPIGANTQFGNGVPAGSSKDSLFQSTNGSFSSTDTDLASLQTMVFSNGFESRMTSTPDTDPNNPNGRIHTIFQNINFNLSQDGQVATAPLYQQEFQANFTISVVTDAKGQLVGSKSTDPRCVAQSKAACGNFTLNIQDGFGGFSLCDNFSSSGFFAVTNLDNGGSVSGETIATFATPTGTIMSIACTSDIGEDGCVGPLLNPTIFPPGGRFATRSCP